MQLSDFTGTPCKSQLAFEFLPAKKTELNLKKTAKTLREKGFTIDFETPVFINVKIQNKNASIFKSGKIMVKETREEKPARNIAETLIKALTH